MGLLRKRRPTGRIGLAIAICFAVGSARASESVVDAFDTASSPAPWTFSSGPEFPGAKGALNSGPGRSGNGLQLAYDFGAGGRYVSASITLKPAVPAVAVGYSVRAPPGIQPKLRVVDATGQNLQYDVTRPLEAFDPSVWYRQVVQLAYPSSHYGGANDGVVHEPLSGITLMAGDPIEAGITGAVDFDDVTVVGSLEPSIAAAGGTMLPAPSGSGDLSARLAVNIHFTRDDRALDIAAGAGFSIVRMDLNWGDVERTKGIYDFSDFDALVTALTARSMRLHLILDHFASIYPDASSSDFEAVTVPAFAKLAKTAASHFAGKHVTYEIWNEPNAVRFWPPTPDPTKYAALCKAAIAALHDGDGSASVTTAGIAEFDYSFFRGYLAAGGGTGANAVGVHPYREGGAETVVADLLWLRKVVKSALSPAPPIWDTEWGYSSAWYGSGHDAVPRRTQAIFTARELLSAWGLGLPLAVYYDLRDDGTDPADPEQNFGLLGNDYADKPAALAVRTLSAAAHGRAFTGFVALEPSSLHAMRLDGTTDVVFAVWSDMAGTEVPLIVTDAIEVVDVLGRPVTPTRMGAMSTLTVREADGPMYVTFVKQGPPPNVSPPGPTDSGAGSSMIDAGVGGASAGAGGSSDVADASAGASARSPETRDANSGPPGASSTPGTSTESDASRSTRSRASEPSCGCRTAPRRSPERAVLLLALIGVSRRARLRRARS